MIPHARLLKGFTLLIVDLAETLGGHLARLSICHTENVISLNSPVHTTIAWNWLSERQHGLCGFWWSDLEEGVRGLVLGLWLDNLLSGGNERLTIVLLSVQISLLLSDSVSWCHSTVECVLLGSENWLLNEYTELKIDLKLNSYK